MVATGGLSIPKIGATDLGYRIARQFGLGVVETRPGLVPLTFDGRPQPFAPLLVGVAREVDIRTGAGKAAGSFREDLDPSRPVRPRGAADLSSFWRRARRSPSICSTARMPPPAARAERGSRKQLANLLAERLPARLAEAGAPLPACRVTSRYAI